MCPESACVTHSDPANCVMCHASVHSYHTTEQSDVFCCVCFRARRLRAARDSHTKCEGCVRRIPCRQRVRTLTQPSAIFLQFFFGMVIPGMSELITLKVCDRCRLKFIRKWKVRTVYVLLCWHEFLACIQNSVRSVLCPYH